ncbi:MAG: choice-of-anchor D domain-containing protein [Acidimicrobiales bacterium]
MEIYNETAGSFTAAASLTKARAYHSTTLLGTGRVLADGGSGTTSVCCVVLSSAEVYTPLSLTFSASSLAFGLLQTGLTSASKTVTVADASSHSVTFSSIVRTGEYVESNTCLTTLKPGRKCTITVTFTPTKAGVQNGTVTLNDNSPGSPKQTITLSGTGEANAISFSPATLTFPGTTPGFSSSLAATLNNDGATTVTLSSVAVTSGGPTFTQTNSCPATLKPGQNCTVSVVFTPPDSGNYGGKISASDSALGSPQVLSLSGMGLNN